LGVERDGEPGGISSSSSSGSSMIENLNLATRFISSIILSTSSIGLVRGWGFKADASRSFERSFARLIELEVRYSRLEW
jgi:hypothetical protein